MPSRTSWCFPKIFLKFTIIDVSAEDEASIVWLRPYAMYFGSLTCGVMCFWAPHVSDKGPGRTVPLKYSEGLTVYDTWASSLSGSHVSERSPSAPPTPTQKRICASHQPASPPPSATAADRRNLRCPSPFSRQIPTPARRPWAALPPYQVAPTRLTNNQNKSIPFSSRHPWIFFSLLLWSCAAWELGPGKEARSWAGSRCNSGFWSGLKRSCGGRSMLLQFGGSFHCDGGWVEVWSIYGV